MKKTFLFIYQWIIAIPLLCLLTVLTALVTIIGSTVGNSNFWGYYPGKYWSRIICSFFFIPVEVTGREHIKPNTSYIFVANHQGAFDIFLLYGYLNHNFKWMMKPELRSLPFVGKACQAAGHIYVDNTSPRKVVETLNEAKKRLQNGVSVIIFPEAERTLDGKMHRFKSGAFQLAKHLDIPIIPLTIEGPYMIMKRHTYNVHPNPMKLTIHQAIYLNKNSAHPEHDLRDQAYQSIASRLSE
ncbi:MAG: lysophospholipid acyltransferase family protein [Bacteroidales bacterium]|nr:lysophospholipid acyltransferase family protein [Bacteroidales bacterium]MDD4823440.1 lysophospholipid acyltransferase family protein [Bacteroidales bacterium]